MTVITAPFPGVVDERASTRTRTRWSMFTSMVVHALLFCWILFAPHTPPGMAPPVTEITFLEGGAPSLAAPPAAPAAAPRLSPGAIITRTVDQAFRRVMRRGEVEPDAQDGNPEDQIQSRLAALQNAAVRPSAGSVAGAPPAMWSSNATTPGGTGVGGSPIALTRGGGSGGTAPLPMVRGTGTGVTPALAPSPAVERSEASQPARVSESSARRTLAGATLMGPIADRAVLVHVTPEYPEWAKREAVEGSVTLYFVVRADGSIKENILVQKTAGFSDFDENARAALRQWRFEPLRDGRTGEQWGTITFQFRIRG